MIFLIKVILGAFIPTFAGVIKGVSCAAKRAIGIHFQRKELVVAMHGGIEKVVWLGGHKARAVVVELGAESGTARKPSAHHSRQMTAIGRNCRQPKDLQNFAGKKWQR